MPAVYGVLAEKGAELLVVNPGSNKLCIGLANSQLPMCLDHCIAYQQRQPNRQHEPSTPPAAAAPTPASRSCQEADSGQREAAYAQILAELGLHHQTPPQTLATASSERQHGGATRGPLIVAPNRQQQGTAEPPDASAAAPKPSVLVGAAALEAANGYELYRPIRAGHLNASVKHSLQRVRDALGVIWQHALRELGISTAQQRATMSAVLVVPSGMTEIEVKELVDVALRELRLQSVVVHLEPVAATFGYGVTGGCVVHIGTQESEVCCVEDGVVVPGTRQLLPYGTADIAAAMLWVLRRAQRVTAQQLSALTPARRQLLDQQLIQRCFLPMEGESLDLETRLHNIELMAIGSAGVEVGDAACVGPVGLFHPDLFGSRSGPPRKRKAREMSAAATGSGDTDGSSSPSLSIDDGQSSAADEPGPSGRGDDIVAELQRLEALMQPLDKAIVQAMAPFDDVELRKRMFTNILVIGAGSAIPGLADMVEARVLHDIPDHDAVDTVNVVLPKSSAPAAVWQGGALLGALDSREMWLPRDAWQEGSVHIGRPSRLSAKSADVQAEVLWYSQAPCVLR